ncbi:MAG TPA: VanZ family protein [Thiobacillaceae bacterium]|nr:VanZ family protein [Thiobacillaceae bacterium]HNA82175.1 VanZ family protein [Thiobacillaceae bacterium]HNF89099.1 VanZ family protein [Thiobacillaceae bacterium]HNH89274.1 VanZ family protein [Thiobacillaceae bacterium]HNI07336.1 VanZ family protein [Thiobacillaceae bacterium]
MDRHAASPVRRARLKRFLLLYCAFLAVASLLPMSGLAPLSNWSTAFLSAPWPRYITRTDLATNLLVYLPLGYALALWFARPGRRATGMALGALGGLALSFVLESGQQLVPGRIASNLDMLVNGLGALSGALLALHHGRWLRALTAAERWRADWFRADRGATLGLALLGLWFATQFSLLPLPGIGWLHLHLRPFDRLPDSLEGLNLPWLLAQFLEIATVGAFVACLVRPGRYVGAMALLLFSAFFTKLLAATILLRLTVVGGVLSLETLAAFLLAFWLLLLPAASRHRRVLALGCLLLTLLTRLILARTPLPTVSALNITGLALHLGALWPALTLTWLLVLGRFRR